MDKHASMPLRERLQQAAKYLIAVSVAIAVISIAFYWFVNSVRSSVYETQLTNMNELAEHDIATIQNFLEDDWESLENTASKGSLRKPDSDEAIATFLREEQVQSAFEDIYLVDDEYSVYSASGITKADPGLVEKNYLQRSHVMDSHDILNSTGAASDNQIFSGVKLHGVTMNGHNMTLIIGKLDLKKIQDRIRISNYNGKGYSSVFDQDGRMIIGINAGGQHLSNFYEFLENSTDLGAEGASQIRERASREDRFSITFTDRYSGQTYVVSFRTIEELDWHFIMSVPKSVFDQQNQNMLSILLTMIGLVIAALLVMMVFVIRSQMTLVRQLEKEKSRQALEEALDQAKAASRAKTTFLFNMSHDIRTPMNAVIGLSMLARNHLGEPDQMAYYMDQIEVAGKQLLSIINNVLELSRIESDKVRIEEEITDTEEIYQSLQTIFLHQNQARELNFRFRNEIRNRWMYMDRTHVEEVIVNLVSNAMKYTEDGGDILVEFSEAAGSDAEHTTLHVIVKDNGIGMSEEYQTRLFQQFEREQTSTVSKIQGTGLGLSIVKKLIDMMNGSIDVNSKQGVGTCMTVDLPLRIAEEPRMVPDLEATEEEMSFEGKHILLAEDIEINAMIATELLEDEGFIVDHAENGKVCVDMLRDAPEDTYDLILMDIQMPEMDGYQATKEIRSLPDEKKSKLPIIAMTANAFQEDRLNALRAG